MAGKSGILDNAAERALQFSGEGRNPGRCESSAAALPWAPASAGERQGRECDR